MNTSKKSIPESVSPESQVLQRVRELAWATREFSADLNSMYWAYDQLFDYLFSTREPVEELATLPIAMLRLTACRMAQIDEMSRKLVPGNFAFHGSADAWLKEFGDTVAPEDRR